VLTNKKRHKILRLGGGDTVSLAVTVTEGAMALLYASSSGSSNIVPQNSPDGGVTWFNMLRQDGSSINYSTSNADRVFQIGLVGGLFRLAFGGTADIDDAYLEMLREVA
jgi:hypothetical protein